MLNPQKKNRHLLEAAASSLIVASIFICVLQRYSYRHFFKSIAIYKGNKNMPVSRISREFYVEKEREQNHWTIEIEFFDKVGENRVFELTLNRIPVAAISVKGKRLVQEFAESLLVEGENALEVSSSEFWTFRRIRVKNIYGYSSGVFSAVIFHKDNQYADLSSWPLSWLGILGLLLFWWAAFVLNLISLLRSPPPQRFFRAERILRWLILLLFLAILLLPHLTRFRLLLGLKSAILLFSIYYALAFSGEVGWLFEKAGGRMLSLAPLLADWGEQVKKHLWFPWAGEDRLSAVFLVIFILMTLFFPGPNPRSGDSLEYQAMLVSWAEDFRPSVSRAVFSSTLKRLRVASFEEGEAMYDDLSYRFATLFREGRELDFPHFWFYSLAAAVFYPLVKLVSINPSYCFMLLHIILLVIAFAVIRKRLGGLAGLSLLLIVFFSPLLWFSNKAQIEFFTVVLSILGLALFIKDDFAAAAFCFAVVSTQNPPFAMLSFLAFLSGFLARRWAFIKRNILFWPVILFLVSLQPAYYWLRHGILNPVMATGGVRIGEDILSAKKMTSFLIDPDIGLFPNWPLSLVLLVVFVVLTIKKEVSLDRRTAVFFLISMPFLLWSQSRTFNVNHGGTINISRYALWHLYIFFFITWQLTLFLVGKVPPAKRFLAGVGAILVILQAIPFRPTRPEEYLKPTWVSRLLYNHVPWVYNPLPEIFVERQIGQERELPEDVWAVSNESGNKIYVWRRALDFLEPEEIPPIPNVHDLDRFLVHDEARRRFSRDRGKLFLFINGRGAKFRRSPAALLGAKRLFFSPISLLGCSS
ncbi:MAG: hypothetical protein QHH14_03560 [Clostridiales bacterium]|nr:hypothetical protein [Clostridiales bacterium]